ncbi:hypothetical protein B0H66DRAFT_638027 [Apodospora peruviana]|uniref:Uncharacterized protein n=1 Tax=Apodospora peruviana TaxID=516989 RepID=A0AAE0IKW5_9PEZI|nr:hypothetical protein B0H66DRAFT_638027 [Apodospora peruviana]
MTKPDTHAQMALGQGFVVLVILQEAEVDVDAGHLSAKHGAVEIKGLTQVPSAETATRVYATLVGHDHATVGEAVAKERASQTLTSLFRSAVSNELLFKALRGNDIAWETIAAAAATLFHDISIADAKLALQLMSAVRYIRLVQETAALGPVHTFTTAFANDGGVAKLAGTLAGIDLTSTGSSSGSSSGNWPPAHFAPRDLVALDDPRVKAALPDDDPLSVLQAAGCQSAPIDLRIVLCGLAMAHYRGPTSPWALFLSPIGYLDATIRQEWYAAAGQQSKVSGTVESFLAYGLDAFFGSW